MIWKMYVLHLQDDLVLEPVKVGQLNLALRVEEYVVVLIVNIATCHVLRKLPPERFAFLVLVADGLHRGVFGMPVDFDHVDYLGLGPLAYDHACLRVLCDYQTQQALYTAMLARKGVPYHSTAVSKCFRGAFHP